MSFWGRYQQGSEIPFTIRTRRATGLPEWVDPAPVLEVWSPTMVKVVSRTMAAYQPGIIVGVYRLPVFLGSLFAGTGKYSVVIRWTDTTSTPVQDAGSFDLLANGNVNGTIIAMTEVDRPDARYLLTFLDSGRILRRKNPR